MNDGAQAVQTARGSRLPKVEGVAEMMPVPSTAAKGAALKAFEDKLDAIVCAWVGICVIEGRATPFGDQDSAIWVPTSHLVA